ncbi:MAG: endolytic transglycosylase MltG [Bacteroidia bacterium]|nr:endolytic transglycosylase MltG [Bacteroidia bacterium]MCX7651446.1 endolytic transglycosylase MltG [Bacteroidia bacterium]MDW8416799.1 endolytic transglycosylase MltG [Bacteroidia bacterium]
MRRKRSKSAKKLHKLSSFPWLQSKRFRVILAVGLISTILLLSAQFVASVEVKEPMTLYIPIDPKAREEQSKQVSMIFPSYTLWHWLVRYGGLRAGRYEIQVGERAFVVWRRLRNGLQSPVRVYLRPQRSPERLAKFLGEVLAYDSATWAASFASYPWESIGLTRYNWIGIFLPDVYELYWTTPPERLIQRVYEVYSRFWTEERRRKAESIGFTPIEVVTLASIVEYETYRNSEKPLIAGVYLNRLRLGMPLQADPTVIFATRQFDANRVTARMLEVDSPYNTYKRRGLPPGPIGMPSIESIEAVLNYTPSEYLFFCARPDGSGYHDFSKSYPEHLIKAKAYQKALNRWLAQKR